MTRKSGYPIFKLCFCRPATDGEMRWCGDEALRLASILVNSEAGDISATDVLNALALEVNSQEFAERFYTEFFNAFVERRVLPEDITNAQNGTDAEFMLNLLTDAVETLSQLTKQLNDHDREKILPSALTLFNDLATSENLSNREKLRAEVITNLLNGDKLRHHRAFRWNLDGEISPVLPDSVKSVKKFYGFPSVRAIYREHFAAFVAGKSNVPLLIYSLPGYGKTSMAVSHALAAENVTLILADPQTLEQDWQKLSAFFKKRPDRKFVLFFDDIDPKSVNWYNFKTYVGGAFSLPGNVMPVISSNYEFPGSVISRGRLVSYPVFDELRCSEMIEDYLIDFGLKRAPRNLVALIANDYTEEFGQKKFSELSPRTLMRYLALYENDSNKRRTMAELSLGDFITKPDGELFYEFNIELMRSLYGEDYIKKLLKEKLKNLE